MAYKPLQHHEPSPEPRFSSLTCDDCGDIIEFEESYIECDRGNYCNECVKRWIENHRFTNTAQ